MQCVSKVASKHCEENFGFTLKEEEMTVILVTEEVLVVIFFQNDVMAIKE
jgi:hypothetical protein